MIGDDIALARALYRTIEKYPELQAVTQSLSITTFRYVPLDMSSDPASVDAYLNRLNEELLNDLQKGGEAFVSNAVVEGKYLLRACIVNFRTTLSDIEALPEIVIRRGSKLDSQLRSKYLQLS